MSSSRSTLSTFSRSSMTLVAAVGFAASAFVVAAPAQAASTGIGTGRAVVHVDAPQATVTKQADGSYLLAMPQGTTGQWMGERKNASGKNVVRVGKLTGEKLASSWSNLKYTSKGASGTLVWDANATTRQTAVVQVSKPKTTDTGVTFSLTSKNELPATMNDVSVNLDRAAKTQAMRSSTTKSVNIVSDLWWSAEGSYGDFSAKVRIYNSTNNNACFGKTVSDDPWFVSVGSNTCDNIAYTDQVNTGTPGAQGVAWISESEIDAGLVSIQMSLYLTPPGQAKYKYTSKISF